MKSHVGKIRLDNKFFNYAFLNDEINVFSDEIKNDTSISHLKDNPFNSKKFALAESFFPYEILAINIENTKEDYYLKLRTENPEYLTTTDTYNGTQKVMIDSFDELIFIGGTINCLFTPMLKHNGEAYIINTENDIIFDSIVNNSNCKITFSTIGLEDNTLYNISKYGKMLNNIHSIKYEALYKLKFDKEIKIDDLSETLQHAIKFIKFISKEISPSFDAIQIKRKDSNPVFYYPNFIHIGKKVHNHGTYVFNMKDNISNAFNSINDKKVNIDFIGFFSKESINIRDFHILSTSIDKYLKEIKVDPNEKKKLKKLSTELKDFLTIFQMNNDYVIKNKEFIERNVYYSTFRNKVKLLSKFAALERMNEYSLTDDEITRFVTLRNSLHGEDIELNDNDIKILSNLTVLLYTYILNDSKLEKSEIFNLTNSIK